MADRYENNVDTSSSPNNITFYGDVWKAQTFTPSTSRHRITKVVLRLKKSESPTGTMTVSIKATDANSYPTGADLCSATMEVEDLTTSYVWYDFTFATNPVMYVGTKYAIVIRRAGGNVNEVYNSSVEQQYSGGTYCYSTDAGSTWDGNTSIVDLNFEEWGDATTNTSMATTVGGFTLTGIAISFLRPIITMAVTVGQFTLTGIDASIGKGYKLVTSVGQFILTGIDAIFNFAGTIWTNQTKHSINPTNLTKNSISPANQTKNSISPTNTSKNSISPTNQTKNSVTFTNQSQS